jgi:hypothetical protein
VHLELGVIEEVLVGEELEPYVAVNNYVPGKDIFCRKICAKIIESRLCIALLTDAENEQGRRMPSPNVYHEYGMMVAWSKPVMPL